MMNGEIVSQEAIDAETLTEIQLDNGVDVEDHRDKGFSFSMDNGGMKKNPQKKWCRLCGILCIPLVLFLIATAFIFRGEPPSASPNTSPSAAPSGTGGGDNGIVYGLQPSCNSVDSDKYNMCLDLGSVSGSYESWMEAFAKAKQRWESIIVGDLPSLSSSGLDTTFTCTGYPSTIDDVYICGRDASIDGLGDTNGNVLGHAAPLDIGGSGVVNPRTGKEYIVARTGIMEFDSADIARLQASGEFDEVVFHEMGHGLGLGSLWEVNELYDEGSGEYASGTHADDEWKTIGCSGPLPVEQDHGPGTADGHWDDECLGNELMTGFISGSSQPVSKITIGSLEDMGYEVDYSQADPFTTADLDVCGSSCPEARRGLRRKDRKMKGKLGSEDRDVVMRYAKTALTKLHKEMEIGAFDRGGGHHDGIKAVDELHVLYQDAKGRVHTVHVSWDEVKDLQI